MKSPTRIIVFFAIFFLVEGLSAQVSMRMMHYNLLYYGNSFICNETNNNTGIKDNSLQIILDHIQPDIFTVNELSNEELYADRILDEVLNVNGVSSWERGTSTVSSGSSIANMLYYDSDKYTLYDQQFVTQALNGSSLLRLVDMYSLYDNASSLLGDTVYFHVLVAHLASSNSGMRFLQCEAAMDMVQNNGPGNYFFSGDFNVDSSSESSYQELTNNDDSFYNFHDPANAPGTWHNNSTYAALHSQSTRSNGNGCHSGGAMDDRFDFTLFSTRVLNGSHGISFVADSYTTFGNDGDNFDQSLHISNNASIPSNVAIALFTASDHLPIVSDYMVDGIVGITDYNAISLNMEMILDSQNELFLSSAYSGNYLAEIYDLQGQLVEQFSFNGNTHSVKLDHLKTSFYIINVLDKTDSRFYKNKFVIKPQ